jgi:hypothetical protein
MKEMARGLADLVSVLAILDAVRDSSQPVGKMVAGQEEARPLKCQPYT